MRAEGELLAGETFFFVNFSPSGGAAEEEAEKKRLSVEVARQGGAVAANYTSALVTRVLAGRAEKSTRYDVACAHADVVSTSWLDLCLRKGVLVDPRPKHYLNITTATIEALGRAVDKFGDSYTERVDEGDVRTLLMRGATAKP